MPKPASACCVSRCGGGVTWPPWWGERIQATGQWVNDRSHGLQFQASFLQSAPPASAEGIEKYLSSGLIRGVGPIYARKLIAAFGDAVFEVIENEPGRLRKLPGIGP